MTIIRGLRCNQIDYVMTLVPYVIPLHLPECVCCVPIILQRHQDRIAGATAGKTIHHQKPFHNFAKVARCTYTNAWCHSHITLTSASPPRPSQDPLRNRGSWGPVRLKLLVINLCIYLSYCFRRNSSFVRTPKDTRYVAAHGRIM